SAPLQDNQRGSVSPGTLPAELALDTKATQGADRFPNANTQELAKNVMREIILPVLEQEVNEGKNFAALRQVFQSLILAGWYKNALKTSLLNQVYANTNKVEGITIPEENAREQVYAQYMEAYRKGVFNFISEGVGAGLPRPISDVNKGEETSPLHVTDSTPRQYFSGGATFDKAMNPTVVTDVAAASRMSIDQAQKFTYRMQIVKDRSDKSQMTEKEARRLAFEVIKMRYEEDSVGNGKAIRTLKRILFSGTDYSLEITRNPFQTLAARVIIRDEGLSFFELPVSGIFFNAPWPVYLKHVEDEIVRMNLAEIFLTVAGLRAPVSSDQAQNSRMESNVNLVRGLLAKATQVMPDHADALVELVLALRRSAGMDEVSALNKARVMVSAIPVRADDQNRVMGQVQAWVAQLDAGVDVSGLKMVNMQGIDPQLVRLAMADALQDYGDLDAAFAMSLAQWSKGGLRLPLSSRGMAFQRSQHVSKEAALKKMRGFQARMLSFVLLAIKRYKDGNKFHASGDEMDDVAYLLEALARLTFNQVDIGLAIKLIMDYYNIFITDQDGLSGLKVLMAAENINGMMLAVNQQMQVLRGDSSSDDQAQVIVHDPAYGRVFEGGVFNIPLGQDMSGWRVLGSAGAGIGVDYPQLKGGIDLGQGDYLKVISRNVLGVPQFDPAQIVRFQQDLLGIVPVPVGVPQAVNVRPLLGLAD
ncbi:MAG: hypothetical protein V2A70_01530, partial [Candidatus Omnitrophota bacterium]